MRLSPARFNQFLTGDVVQHFAWRQRSACPCVTPSSGQAKFNCPLCLGKGHLWADEVAGHAGMTNQTPQKAQAIFGSWETGDCVLTIPSNSPLYAARQFDRFRAIDSTNPFSEVLVPGRVARLLGKIVSIDRVFWVNTAGDEIVEGGIPSVDVDGNLSWTADAPPAGVSYTVEGIRYDEFFCFKPLAVDRNSGVSGLPRKLAARVFSLLGH